MSLPVFGEENICKYIDMKTVHENRQTSMCICAYAQNNMQIILQH